jgi:hypothetical protein
LPVLRGQQRVRAVKRVSRVISGMDLLYIETNPNETIRDETKRAMKKEPILYLAQGCKPNGQDAILTNGRLLRLRGDTIVVRRPVTRENSSGGPMDPARSAIFFAQIFLLPPSCVFCGERRTSSLLCLNQRKLLSSRSQEPTHIQANHELQHSCHRHQTD